MVTYGGGGDFNAQAGSIAMRVEVDACGRFEIEKMNAVGRDFFSFYISIELKKQHLHLL